MDYNVLNDFEETIQRLPCYGGQFTGLRKPCIKKERIQADSFLRQRYFLLYRVEGHTVFADRIVYELQDCENKLK